MIKTAIYAPRDLSGVWHGQIIGIEPEDNQYHDPKRQDSTEQVLSIMFELANPSDAQDTITHTERFVAPVFGGGRLFDQLAGLFGAGNPGEAFNEQSLLGKCVDVELGKNKKGYTTVLYVSASSKAVAPVAPVAKVKAAPTPATPATAAETPEDLPWEEATA